MHPDIKSKENVRNKHMFRYISEIGQVCKISPEFASNQSSSIQASKQGSLFLFFASLNLNTCLFKQLKLMVQC